MAELLWKIFRELRKSEKGRHWKLMTNRHIKHCCWSSACHLSPDLSWELITGHHLATFNDKNNAQTCCLWHFGATCLCLEAPLVYNCASNWVNERPSQSIFGVLERLYLCAVCILMEINDVENIKRIYRITERKSRAAFYSWWSAWQTPVLTISKDSREVVHLSAK